MIELGPVTLDLNDQGAFTTSLSLSGESLITMYVVDKSGTHNIHEIGIQMRPTNSGDWFQHTGTITGIGCKTYNFLAKEVRAIVQVAEGQSSEADIYIIAN